MITVLGIWMVASALTDIAAGVTAGSIDFPSDLSGKNTGWNGNNRITREHCHSGGHSSLDQLSRYVNLRAEDLVDY